MKNSTTKATSKSTNKIVEELKLYDVKRKMVLARSIVTACMNQTINRTDITQNDFYTEAQNYITTSDLLMKTILAKLDTKGKHKTFSDWFKERLWFHNHSEDTINATQALDKPLRQSLIDHYVEMQRVPTYASICDDLKRKGIKINIDEIKKILMTKGYRSQRLPRSTISIIVEDPEQKFNRMKYLFDMSQLRDSGRHIVYIEESIVNNVTENALITGMILTRVAVSRSMGVIHKKIQNLKMNGDIIEDIETRDDWILNRVIPYLSIPSVIVMEDRSSAKSPVPTINSSKRDMINWLKENEIPHTPEMHSAELFEIIKRSKRNCSIKKPKIDEILNAHGHKVLRRPCCPNNLNIFSDIWSQLQNAYEEILTPTGLIDLIDIALCSISSNDWKKLEKMLIKTETKMYSDDKAVDEVIDKLFTYAKHATLPYIYIYKCDENIDEIKMAEIVQD